MMNSFKVWLWLPAVFCLACHPQADNKDAVAEAQQVVRPNVILIMADDMGYADLGCYGNETIKTPNIDNLASNGLRLTNYHSSGVVCSPTRAALLTGLYPQEAGIEGVVTAKSHRDTGMKPEKYTLAEMFKRAGYTTAIFGKWHLGYEPKFGPIVQGFDVFNGFVSGNVDYQSHIDQEGYADWWKQKGLNPEDGYLTNLITDHGLQFMEQEKDQPFFLYLPHGAPHSPYQGPDDPADRTVGGDFPIHGSRKDIPQAYKEMVEALDSNVGRIMSFLEENALLENTLVIFCSDNGAPKIVGSNAPFSGFKGQVFEGGHRVPAIFYWKGKIQASVSDNLMLSMDIFPTIADILEIDTQAQDQTQFSGKSMISILLEGADTTEERTVFWRFKEQKAARKGNWKLVVNNGDMSLYDLSEDPQESTDVKEENQPIFQELQQALEHWESQLKEEIRA